jgi:hypothetical protein
MIKSIKLARIQSYKKTIKENQEKETTKEIKLKYNEYK